EPSLAASWRSLLTICLHITKTSDHKGGKATDAIAPALPNAIGSSIIEGQVKDRAMVNMPAQQLSKFLIVRTAGFAIQPHASAIAVAQLRKLATIEYIQHTHDPRLGRILIGRRLVVGKSRRARRLLIVTHISLTRHRACQCIDRITALVAA